MPEKWLKVEVEKTILIDVYVRTSDEQLEAMARQDITASIAAYQSAIADPASADKDRERYQAIIDKLQEQAPDLSRVPRAMASLIEYDVQGDHFAFDYGDESIAASRLLEEVPAEEAKKYTFIDLLADAPSP